MRIEYRCPICDSWNAEPGVERLDRVRCPCGYERRLRGDAIEGSSLRACPWCATTDLYVQKDFPRALGLGLLGFGLLLSSIFYYYLMPLWSMAVLVLFAVIDAVLYRVVPDLVVCYRCGNRFRELDGDGDHEPFDLEVGERYRQERLRAEQLRRDGGTATSASAPGSSPSGQ